MSLFMVDSASPANAEVQPGLSLFDDVVAWAGAPPAAWGRYLGDGYGAAVPLSASEAGYLRSSRGCPILPIYNLATSGGVGGDYAQGQADASRAIQLAKALDVPAGVYIACDIEAGWQVSAPWLNGWADTMRASTFAGSGILYGSLGGPGLAHTLLCALGNPNVQRLLLWAATPETGPSTSWNMPAWNPDAPSPQTAGMVRLWQYSRGDYGGWVDLNQLDASLLGAGLWMP